MYKRQDVLYDYNSKYANGGSIHEFPAKIENKAYKEAMKLSLIHI